MGTDFILVKFPDPLTLLAETFPEVQDLLQDPELGSYYVYNRFAEHLELFADDEQLWNRAYSFFETLAAANKDLLIEIFESLCLHETLKERLDRNLGPMARALFDVSQDKS